MGPSGEPNAARLELDAETAGLLDMAEGEAAHAVEQPLVHQASGTRARHRMILPMGRITGTPLAKNPAGAAAKAYTILATSHGDLA